MDHNVLGFPILGVEWQKMENPDLRMSMGMGNEHKGVRIKRIEPTAPSNILSPSDIILSFDGVDVANDGTGVSLFLRAVQLLEYNFLFYHYCFEFLLSFPCDSFQFRSGMESVLVSVT